MLLGLVAAAVGGLAAAAPTLRGAEGNDSAPEGPPNSTSTAAPTSPDPCAELSAVERSRTPVCAYSEEEAVEFRFLSAAAICDPALLESWSCGVPCQHTPAVQDVRLIDDRRHGGRAFVGRLRGQCVLVFRATDSLAGWVTDLQSSTLTDLPNCSAGQEACRVGRGFLQGYGGLADGIQSALAEIGCDDAWEPLVIGGHSLGGALATLAAFDLLRLGYNVTRAYTFGQPRVGDAAFASAFAAALASVPFLRVTRRDDPVVYLPPPGRFRHVATEVHYDGSVLDGFRICDASFGEDPSCAGQRSAVTVAGLLLRCASWEACGHMRYFEPLTDGLLGAAEQCRHR